VFPNSGLTKNRELKMAILETCVNACFLWLAYDLPIFYIFLLQFRTNCTQLQKLSQLLAKSPFFAKNRILAHQNRDKMT
jgi:hypothetical protein